MSTEVTTNIAAIIEKEGFRIRTVVQNEETLYAAKDICKSLGLGDTAHVKKIRHLDADEVRGCPVGSTHGGTQMTKFVTEPGLYKMILWSKNAKKEGTPAHSFVRWITHDVLPQIRKNGMYKLENKLRLKQAALNTLATDLEHATHDLAGAEDELEFVEQNRLYKFAFNIQSVRNRGVNAYNFVKQQANDHFAGMLAWRDGVPYIIRGHENTVRTRLQ